MTPADTAKILTLISQYNGMTVDKARTLAWHDLIGDLDFETAVEAVKNHFRTSDAWMQPQHLLDGVKKIYSERKTGLERSARTVDIGTAIIREVPAAKTWDAAVSAFMPVAQQRENKREREAQKAEEVRRRREERAARCPAFAEAMATWKTSNKANPARKKTGLEHYLEDSKAPRQERERQRQINGDAGSLKSILPQVVKRVQEGSQTA